ncbi:ABC transporter permease subunit [Pendulispora rubella]|uniref:ABC transporter permease subunit n=1 Tax=Pendulispora rubella TaxID=2741070 RepID=A0ABZ2L8V6_9BACT
MAVGLAVLWPLAHVLLGMTTASLAVLGRATTWALLGRTLLSCLEVTATTVVLGVPLGAVFARGRIPARRVWLALHALPLFLPPFVIALGWFHWLGERGLVGSARTSAVLFGPVGHLLVLTTTFTPIVTALTMLGMTGLDASLEEAALLVAPPWRVLTRLLVPAARSRIAVAAIIVFSLTLSEVGVPMFLRVPVYGAAVFVRLGGVDFAPGEAASLGVPMVVLGFVLIGLERALASSHGALRLRWRTRDPMDLGAWPGVMTIFAGLFASAPLLALAVRAVPGMGRCWSWAGPSMANSLVVSGAAAAIAMGIALIAGHALARGSLWASALDRVTVTGFFLPSAVLGTGIIAGWNRPATQRLYGSLAIVIVGFVARYTALGTRIVAASIANTSRAYEDAGSLGGAGYFRQLARIVIPLHARELVAAFGIAMVFGLRDLETAVLFYPPGGETLTVRIFTLEANGPSSVVAALALLQVILSLAVVTLGAIVMKRLR